MNIDEKVLELARQKLGQLLAAQREELGMSKYQVSKVSGLSMTQLLSIERGSKRYTIDSLFAYAMGLDCYLQIALAAREGKHLDLDDLISKMKR